MEVSDTSSPTHEHIVEKSSNGTALIIGLVILLVLGVLFFYYGLPIISQSFNRPAVQIPSQIDVNVNQPGQTAPAK